jgi:hypothetical protein
MGLFATLSILTLDIQWVENNPTNIRIFLLTSIFLHPFLSPDGTTLMAIADVNTDVAGC